jgi:drug/metabolite transporter (DMT)-like permease
LEKKNPGLGRLALVATTMIWGTSFVVQKNTLDSISTLYLLSIRFTVAAVFLLLLGIKNIKQINKEYIKGGVIMGVLLSAAYIVQTYGLVYTTPGKNAFLTASYCVITPFLFWIFKRQRPDKYNFIAAALCILGVGLISVDSNLSINKGDALTLMCGVFYAFHIMAIDRHAEGKNPALLTAVQFGTAAVITWTLALVFEPFPTEVPSSAMFSLGYLSIVCTGVCYLLQTFGQKNTPATQASILLTLEAVFGTLVSVIFYHEKMDMRLVTGFVIMFISVLISETKLSFLKRRSRNNKREYIAK